MGTEDEERRQRRSNSPDHDVVLNFRSAVKSKKKKLKQFYKYHFVANSLAKITKPG